MPKIDKSKPRPVYVKRLPPCNNACPAGNNIQKWLFLVKHDRFKEAWEAIIEESPFPATLGRVCYYPCEHACNRYSFEAAVNVNAVERFLGDMALEEGWTVPLLQAKSGKKVLLVGAGAAGLSCAYHLCRLGHDVTVLESAKVGGGMMHYGIPSYRLPRNILDAEVKKIENMGVKIVYNHKVTDLLKEKDADNFAAVFVALGAPIGRNVTVPQTGNGCEIIDSLKLLEDIEYQRAPDFKGLNVVVYGGGNTAIDAARSAVRLGAKKVEIVYRRNREKMPAYDFEVAEAAAEGITLRLLRTIHKIDDKIITLDVMELNAEGWPEATGKNEIISADVVIMALGLNVDTDFLRQVPDIEFKKDGTLIVDEHLMTGAKGIFAGGDVIPYDRSVTTAVGHGKKAAYNIDAYLRGELYNKPEKNELASHDVLHVAYYQKTDRKNRHHLNVKERKNSFTEVVNSLNEDEVLHEANRCFSCGNCFECDTCYNICPVKAITKLGSGKGYHIDDDVCIRCGLCVKKCPCGAMKLVEEK